MNKLVQMKVLNEMIESIVEIDEMYESVEVIDIPNETDSNKGKLSIQHIEFVGEFGDVSYDFKQTSMEFTITINGQVILNSDYDDVFCIDYNDVDGYKDFLNRLVESVKLIEFN